MTHDELIEKVAKAINGPFHPVPEGSPYTLDQLRDIRWTQINDAERKLCLAGAKAAISTVLAALDDHLERLQPIMNGPLPAFVKAFLETSPLGDQKG